MKNVKIKTKEGESDRFTVTNHYARKILDIYEQTTRFTGSGQVFMLRIS